MSGKISTSLKDFKPQKNALTYRLFVDYPNDLIDNFMSIESMQKNFYPELGYIQRTNYDSYSWYFRLTPRWFTKLGVKRWHLNHGVHYLQNSFNRQIGKFFK